MNTHDILRDAASRPGIEAAVAVRGYQLRHSTPTRAGTELYRLAALARRTTDGHTALHAERSAADLGGAGLQGTFQPG